jgi:hypothetical protein
MKIIGISNFDLESVNDVLICENVNRYYGEIIVTTLNNRAGPNAQYYYKLKDDDYELYKFEP